MKEDIPKKILVVDDEEIIRSLLSDILVDVGYVVKTASSGSEALKLTDEFMPDLIILDIILPDMGGSNVATRLKEKQSTVNIPVVFLSGLIPSGENEFLRLGEVENIMQYVVGKPVERKELLDIVSKVISNY